MDEPELCTNTSRKFSDDITTVYGLIKAYRNQISVDDKPADKSNVTKYTGIVTTAVLIIIAGIYAALYFLPHSTWGDSTEDIRLFIQMIVLLFYVLGGVVILLQYFSLKDMYNDFTGQIIGFASDAAKDEAALFEEFDKLSRPSIEYVANRLEQDSTQLGQIRTVLLGAIEKVGIIPGLIATVAAISNVAGNTGVSWIELLSFVLTGIYISMFPITEASIRIKRMSVLLNQYLELFRSSNGQGAK